MIHLKDIVKKYFKRNRKYISSDNILHEMNGVVLVRTNNQIFDFHSAMIEEVQAYCINQGFGKVDKIIFLSSYDTDLHDSSMINVKMKGESKIKIIQENGDLIAVVCMCECVNVKTICQKYI